MSTVRSWVGSLGSSITFNPLFGSWTVRQGLHRYITVTLVLQDEDHIPIGFFGPHPEEVLPEVFGLGVLVRLRDRE